jgi:hypothetical protein
MIWSLIFSPTWSSGAFPRPSSSFPGAGSRATCCRSTRPRASCSIQLPLRRRALSGPRAATASPRPRLHLHVEPRLQSRSARAHLAHSRPHLGLHEAVAHEFAHPRHRLPPGRIHRRRSQRQPPPTRSAAWPRRSACSPRASTSPHLLKARARPTAACCPSRRARSFSPWPPARRAFPVSIYGTETMLRKGSLRIHPGRAHVIFHRPSTRPGFASRGELMRAVRAAIASGLPEWMRMCQRPDVSHVSDP